MSFKKDDATGGLIWDRSTAGDRWGKGANRPDAVEVAELAIESGMIGCVWDWLAMNRPDDLTDTEERMIVRKALRRSVEKGRMHANTAEVLIRLVGGYHRLKTENKIDHAAIREYFREHPRASLRTVADKFATSRDTVSRIRRKELSDK